MELDGGADCRTCENTKNLCTVNSCILWHMNYYISIFFFFFKFWPCHKACRRILVPQPGIEPESQQGKHRVLTAGPLGNFLSNLKIKGGKRESA